MSKTSTHSIEHALLQSNAKAEFCATLNNDFGLAIWNNKNDRVTYQRAAHHTLSCYLEGGHSTTRLDQKSAGFGAPDKLCILPAEQPSDWVVGDYQRFAHIYFSDSILRRIALESFDIDPRLVELPDTTYFDDQLLSNYHRHLIQQDWRDPQQRLQLQEDMHGIIGNLIDRYCTHRHSQKYYRSGLSHGTLRRVIDYIYASLDKTIYLEELAKVAKLSEFHFSRMFKISTGETVHQRVIRIRLQHACDLLAQGQALLSVAIACGFANQSHFSRVFKQHIGITPKQYQRIKYS